MAQYGHDFQGGEYSIVYYDFYMARDSSNGAQRGPEVMVKKPYDVYSHSPLFLIFRDESNNADISPHLSLMLCINFKTRIYFSDVGLAYGQKL